MKRVVLAGLNACPRCQRAVAFLKVEGEEYTIGVSIDASKAWEISYSRREPGENKSLAGLLLELMARYSHVPYQVVLDCDKRGFLNARVNMTGAGTMDSFSCSVTEGVGLAAVAAIPLYVEEKVFEHSQLLHPGTPEEEIDLVQPKAKVTLH